MRVLLPLLFVGLCLPETVLGDTISVKDPVSVTTTLLKLQKVGANCGDPPCHDGPPPDDCDDNDDDLPPDPPPSPPDHHDCEAIIIVRTTTETEEYPVTTTVFDVTMVPTTTTEVDYTTRYIPVIKYLTESVLSTVYDDTTTMTEYSIDKVTKTIMEVSIETEKKWKKTILKKVFITDTEYDTETETKTKKVYKTITEDGPVITVTDTETKTKTKTKTVEDTVTEVSTKTQTVTTTDAGSTTTAYEYRGVRARYCRALSRLGLSCIGQVSLRPRGEPLPTPT